MLKVFVLLDGGGDDVSVLDALRGLDQRARLSLEVLVLNGAWAPPTEAQAVPELVVTGQHGLAMPPYRPPYTQSASSSLAGLSTTAANGRLIGHTNGHSNGHAQSLASGEVIALPAWLQPLLKGYHALTEREMPQALLALTPYADLVLISRSYLRAQLLAHLDRWTTTALAAPIFVPAPDAELPKRVLVPADIAQVRMVTPLRRYLFAGAQAVLFSCVHSTERSQRDTKQLVSYMQAHHQAPSFYTVDAMEGRGLQPILAPHSLLVASLSASPDCESRVSGLMPLLEAPYSSWQLSFLILP